MRLWLAAATVAALTLAACGGPPSMGVPPSSLPASPSAGPPTQALVPWDGFPADQVPRPVVLIGNSSPQDGFSSDAAKTAAFCHKFRSGTTLSNVAPNGAQASWGDGTVAIYPATSPAAALAAMMQPPTGTSDPYCPTVPPLVLTGARFGAFEFMTDRGRALIYSWLFTVSGANSEMAYPALAAPALWNADLTNGASDGGATVSTDGRALTFSFWGLPAGSGPCSAEYRGVVAESHAAVAVAVQMIPKASPSAPVACPAIAQQRTVTVTLASPLGGRVVANASGAAMTVCPAASPKIC